MHEVCRRLNASLDGECLPLNHSVDLSEILASLMVISRCRICTIRSGKLRTREAGECSHVAFVSTRWSHFTYLWIDQVRIVHKRWNTSHPALYSQPSKPVAVLGKAPMNSLENGHLVDDITVCQGQRIRVNEAQSARFLRILNSCADMPEAVSTKPEFQNVIALSMIQPTICTC